MITAASRTVIAALALASAAGSLATPPEDAARARVHYLHHCVGCHVADGSGAPGKGIPSMRGALGQFVKVPGGREFIAQVPGVMNSPLNDRDIANLMNWLLPYVSADTLPAGTARYTADEIARLRGSRPVDVLAVRRELVERMHQAGVTLDEAAAPR